MGRHSIELSSAGAGRPFPLSDFSWFWQQSRFPDPQKKKKKKWNEVEVGPDHYFHVVPTGQLLSSRGLENLSGLKVVMQEAVSKQGYQALSVVVVLGILQRRHVAGSLTRRAVSPS